MKNADRWPSSCNWISEVIAAVLDGVLGNEGSVVCITASEGISPLGRGYHSHDSWELFCPFHGNLSFVSWGEKAGSHPPGSMLMVPPGLLHLAIDQLPQHPDLELMIFSLPGPRTPGGVIHLTTPDKRLRAALSAQELVQWQGLCGASPSALLERASRALAGNHWGQARGIAILRLLFSGYGEVASSATTESRVDGERRIGMAVDILETRYFESDLGVEAVASQVGLSVSHFTELFRRRMGQTPYQFLLRTRLRRAAELLVAGRQRVKEIAACTGWSNQLYFSTAFRRRYGLSPTAWRKQSNHQRR